MLVGILIGSVGILIGSVGILIGSVGILIHWYFEHWYFERWYFEPLPLKHQDCHRDHSDENMPGQIFEALFVSFPSLRFCPLWQTFSTKVSTETESFSSFCLQTVTLLQVLPPISAADTFLSFLQNFAKKVALLGEFAIKCSGTDVVDA